MHQLRLLAGFAHPDDEAFSAAEPWLLVWRVVSMCV